MDRAVGDDPAQVLVLAERDGLLTYHGYMDDGGFEVELVGQALVLRPDAVGSFVAGIRAVRELAGSGVAVRIAGLDPDVAGFVLEVDGRRVSVPRDQVADWCAGFSAARAGGRAPEHVGEDHVGQLVELFMRPSRDDQCRMVILGLMHGRGEDQRVSNEQLAEMVGRSKKTVVDAMMFGKYLASALAEDMIRAFGWRWSITDGGAEPLDEARAGEAPPQMPELVRLRRIVDASLAGWVRYVDVESPNWARWSKAYRLVIGDRVHVVAGGELLGWLAGVEAFHQGG